MDNVANKKNKVLELESELRLSRYRREKNQQLLLDSIIYLLLLWVFVLFVMVVSGDRFSTILSFLGIQGVWNQKQGVYVDCNLPKNKASKFCQGDVKQIDAEWQKITRSGGVMFSLNGD